jgi:hypothetical protein
VAEPPPGDGERQPAPSVRTAKPDPVTWDSYLSGGNTEPVSERPAPPPEEKAPSPRVPEDDEWSEPFRMLLKGDGSENAPDTSKPRRR